MLRSWVLFDFRGPQFYRRLPFSSRPFHLRIFLCWNKLFSFFNQFILDFFSFFFLHSKTLISLFVCLTWTFQIFQKKTKKTILIVSCVRVENFPRKKISSISFLILWFCFNLIGLDLWIGWYFFFLLTLEQLSCVADRSMRSKWIPNQYPLVLRMISEKDIFSPRTNHKGRFLFLKKKTETFFFNQSNSVATVKNRVWKIH